MEFESQGSRNLWAVAAECQRGPAPSETFIYSIAAGWHFIDFHDFFGFMGFHEISWISSVRSRETCGGLCRRVPTRSCSFGNLYSIPGGCYFIDFSWFHQVFIRFHEISWISRVGGRETCGVFAAECHRGPAPSETFTRSQLAAISSMSVIVHDFHKFSKDFMRFHGFQESMVGVGCYCTEFHGFSRFS